MSHWIQEQLKRWKQTETLLIATRLLFELLIVLWVSFLALFALETLLPTFVTIRISLTFFLAFIVLATIFYCTLEKQLDAPSEATETPQWVIIGLWVFGVSLIALSLARFPLLPGILFLLGSIGLTWFLWRLFANTSR